MYLSKESIVNLFFQMNFLYSGEDIQKQGGTQFFSELKYFFALDEFIKSEQRPCDTRNKNDKQKFVVNVGHFVQLSDPNTSESLDAKNFFDSFGQNKDFDVGSNFFSAGAVNKSLTSTTPLSFPSRHPQLLKCENGVIDIADGAYQRFANEQDYLYYQDRKKKTILPNKKALLFFWLNRNTDFTSKDSLFNDFLNSLRKRYSPNMISALKWDEQNAIYTNIARNLSTSNDISFVKKEDLIFDQKDSYQRKKYFETWLCLNSSGDDGFRTHCVDVCEQWLDKKMPGNQIGNLFRYKDYESYKREHIRITALKDFSSVSDNDQSGRARTAINHYLNFLNKMPHTEKVDDDIFVKLLKQLEQEIEKNPERIDALKKLLPLEEKKDKDSSGTQSLFYFNFTPFTPTQKIYYGVPGCGKSHTITTMLKDEKVKDPTFSEENQVVRTTFHPEYTNADFIGQILPEVHEDSQGKSVVEYKFKPGPFAKILKQALHNPSRPFYLVIEEINRGNAAAIFGDVFQLLDRLKNGDTSKEPVGTDGFENQYGKGWSEYFVMNADVNAYIRDANSEDELDTKSIDISGIHFSSSTGLRLPPNLSIYATMNTSDQNVFTLDNAFQRRWDMELVPNTCNWNDEDHKKQAQSKVGDTEICWETFRKAINGKISDGDFFNADDKQLGLFFIEAEGDKIDGKKFANKVLKYLWADVFKRDTGKIFKSENLSGVVENFTGTDAFDKVFVEDFAQSLKNANDEIKNHE